jgi:hypothetical protein
MSRVVPKIFKNIVQMNLSMLDCLSSMFEVDVYPIMKFLQCISSNVAHQQEDDETEDKSLMSEDEWVNMQYPPQNVEFAVLCSDDERGMSTASCVQPACKMCNVRI